jgi:hypothetical protein
MATQCGCEGNFRSTGDRNDGNLTQIYMHKSGQS